MEKGRIVHAVERIEAALARVDAATRHAADLQRQHHDLKAAVARSIADIDRLMAGPPA